LEQVAAHWSQKIQQGSKKKIKIKIQQGDASMHFSVVGLCKFDVAGSLCQILGSEEERFFWDPTEAVCTT
jgi:hypothetical protein